MVSFAGLTSDVKFQVVSKEEHPTSFYAETMNYEDLTHLAVDLMVVFPYPFSLTEVLGCVILEYLCMEFS